MSDAKHLPMRDAGPFRTDQLHSGDPYELSNGHAIRCAPTGGDGTGPNLRGGFVLDSDPAVKNAGVDAGFAFGPYTMRAPDVAVGDFDDKPGWIQGVPPLAVEYASVGQDEAQLREKIDDFLRVGVRYLWVVRLAGPRRVEVYEKGKPARTVLPGEALTAPGVLQNPVPVEALYDREAAHEVAFTNLLQRKGYRDLDAVRSEGIEEGIEKGIEQGIEQGGERALAHQFERKVGRALGPAELATLRARLRAVGPERVGDVVLDLDGPALLAWLIDPVAV
jgi:Uma2 family endonuclease